MTGGNSNSDRSANYEEQINYEDIYSMMGSMMTQAFSDNQKSQDKKKAKDSIMYNLGNFLKQVNQRLW